LIKVGADRISSINQETKSARLLNAIWDEMVDAVLGAHPWKFATKRATLAPTSTTPAFGFDYEYDIPADCLRPLDTDPDDINWVVENGKILSDESTLDIRYIWRNTDPASWDARFCEALAWKLAENVSYALAPSIELRSDCRKGFAVAMQEARTMDASQGILRGLVADTFTRARR
jgi:hypothetical protein